jgi:hypothetical protein
MILGVDGCFGGHTKSALDKFLIDQGFDKYNNKAKAKLYSLAEDAFNNRLNSNSSPNSQTYDAIAFDGSSYNYEVENLQYCLNMLGYTGLDNRMLDIDGYFGDNTKCALYKFLNAQGFEKYNNETRSKLISMGRDAFSNRLNQDSASTSDSSPYAAPSDMITFDGSSYNGEVAYMQYCLNKLGYTDSDNSTLDTDGIIGNHTKSALNKYINTGICLSQ